MERASVTTNGINRVARDSEKHPLEWEPQLLAEKSQNRINEMLI